MVYLMCGAESASNTAVALLIICCMLQDEVFLNGTIVLPHKELKETVLDQGTIIM